MHHYFEALTNTSGDSLIGYYGRVINPATLAVVTLAADDNGTPISTVSGHANLAKTDEYGNLSFYVAAGTYHLDIYAPDAVTFRYRVENVGMESVEGPPGPQGDKGDPGAAGNVAASLAQLKAAAIGNVTMLYDAATFTWTAGNYTGLADDINVVASNGTPISSGAWVRQAASKIQYAATGETVSKALDRFTLRTKGQSGVTQPVIVVDQHFALMRGIGRQAGDPGNSPGAMNSTTVVSATAETMTLTSATNFFTGQVIVYGTGSPARYYTNVIHALAGNVATMGLPWQNGFIPTGGDVVANYWRDAAHPTQYGQYALVDYLLEHAGFQKRTVFKRIGGAGWTAYGSGIVLSELTTAALNNPGGADVGTRALKVRQTGSGGIDTGAISEPFTGPAGTYEVDFLWNPGFRDGPFKMNVDVLVQEILPTGETYVIGSKTYIAFDAIQSDTFQFSKRQGSTIRIVQQSNVNGPFEWYQGRLVIRRVEGANISFNQGTHVLLGDSYFAGGDYYTRLVQRCPNATIINKGFSGDTTAAMLARFFTDVAPFSPDYVHLTGGTNDLYKTIPAQVTAADYQTNMSQLVNNCRSIGAQPIVFTPSVGVDTIVSPTAPTVEFGKSRLYAYADVSDSVEETWQRTDASGTKTVVGINAEAIWTSPKTTRRGARLKIFKSDGLDLTNTEFRIGYSNTVYANAALDDMIVLTSGAEYTEVSVPKTSTTPQYLQVWMVVSTAVTRTLGFTGQFVWME